MVGPGDEFSATVTVAQPSAIQSVLEQEVALQRHLGYKIRCLL